MPLVLRALLAPLLSLLIMGAVAQADIGLLRAGKPMFAQARPLFDAPRADARQHVASLFIGTAEGGLFATLPPPVPPVDLAGRGGTAPERLRHLIGLAESRLNGYDAVQHGARIKPTLPPTTMTIAQIDQWIADTPGQPHAIGRYQFIPATLRRLVRRLGVTDSARFSPGLQDRLADVLLREAGFETFVGGLLTRETFMNNMARIWAGLPTSDGTSHYHGFAGNTASITWAQYKAAMTRIFPG